MPVSERLRVADECWIALANLHREHPERRSFTAKEIVDRLRREGGGEVRAGVQPHIYLHNVANLAPSSGRYRMFYKEQNGTYRLYRPGDYSHPERTGKTKPKREELPLKYEDLLDWYENEYCRRDAREPEIEDPVLQMLGAGAEIWQQESGDEFIARERSGWKDERDTSTGRSF